MDDTINPETIDDEFASLFLQELQNTRSVNSKRNDNSNLVNTDPNQSDMDYINSINLNSNPVYLPGNASYARYLPLETTLTSSFLDLHDLSYPTINEENHLPTKYVDKNDGTINLSNINYDDCGSENYIANKMLDQKSIHSHNNQRTVINKLDKKKTESAKNENLLDLHLVCNKVLSLNDLNEDDSIIAKNEKHENIDLKFGGSINGRIYINSETFKNLSQYQESISDLLPTQLFCYRRNSISIHFSLNFDYKKLNNEGQLFVKLSNENTEFKKISLNLFTSLRKRNSSNSNGFSIIKETEEFILNKSDIENKPSIKSNPTIIHLNRSNITLTYDDLLSITNNKTSNKNDKNNNTLNFCWDQLRFKSATANNRHDAADKFYIVVLMIKLLDCHDNIIVEKPFVSLPIIVRGRAPSFYLDKGDVLIGRFTKQLNKMTRIEHNHQKRAASENNNSNNLNSSLLPKRHKVDNANLPNKETQLKDDNNNKSLLSQELQNIEEEKGEERKKENEKKEEEKEGEEEEEEEEEKEEKEEKEEEEEEEEYNEGEDEIINDDTYSNNNKDENRFEVEENEGDSLYQYFKVEDNYYLPPVEVGYFPHHVHHNKQVFKPSIIPSSLSHNQEIRKQYNYFI